MKITRQTHRAFRIATVLSTMLLIVTILLFLGGFVLNPWKHFMSISDSFHVTVWAYDGLDSRIVFFNHADYGPYTGSIIQICDGEDCVPPLIYEMCIGDTWGIYYRYFQFEDAILWTLMTSLWYPIILIAIMPAMWILRRADVCLPTKKDVTQLAGSSTSGIA